MKQTLIALLVLVVLASCEQKNDNADAEKSDMTEEVSVKKGEESPYSQYAIPEDTGNTWIQNYHRFLLDSLHVPKSKLHVENLSFMLDADMLRTYLADTSLKMLDIYLAQKSNGKMTLVYVGATVGHPADNPDSTIYTEQQLIIPGNTDAQVLDHAFPCPTCEERVQILGGKPE